ncbi:MAG: hypothetical protein Q4A56_07000, partial [Porphyromonadaceae bacterium]|nr:hypothetical protein [Porphyromonadaceae bacterium]
RIELKNNSIDENSNHIILKNSKLCWDTGANSTAFFKDFGQKKFLLMFSLVFEYGYKIRIQKVKYSNHIEKDSVILKNIIYLDVDSQNTAQWINNEEISGIVGMNVISKYNWIVDFDKNILQNLSKTTTYNHTPQFTLCYSNTMKPKTTISIADVKLKNILIDSGFNIDFTLLSSDIEKINQRIAPDTICNIISTALFSDSIVEFKYKYSNIMINNIRFDTLYIVEGNRRLIGTGFFRKFDRVFWDSGSKEVRFYRD